MQINTKLIKQLRDKTGAGIMDCKQSLIDARGDINKAIELLRKKGTHIMAKKSERETKEGIIEAYIHSNGKVGVLLEINCESDFVARNKEFKELAHNIAMQIAAIDPKYIKPEDVPDEIVKKEREIYKEQFKKEGKPEKILDKIIEGKIKKYKEEVALLTQPFIKDEKKTITDLITEKVTKLGENIKVSRFIRYEI